MPKVSVGLPVYNGDRYLKQVLECLTSQTFADFEVIISDNASTDETQRICEEHCQRDKRFRYFRNVKNLGLAPNHNRVFELSSGQYFKWASHDDLFAPDYVEKCVDVLDSNLEIVDCFSKVKVIDQNGKHIEDYDPLPATSSDKPQVRFSNLILNPDGRAIQFLGLMRVDYLKKTRLVGPYPSSDEIFIAHMALFGKFYEIPEHLYYYRSHEKQSTKGVLASERSRVLVFDTSTKNRIVLLKWMYVKDCWFAINRSPITSYQRLTCLIHLLRWFCKPENFRSVMKDLLLAIHQRIPLFPGLHREALDAARKSHHYE